MTTSPQHTNYARTRGQRRDRVHAAAGMLIGTSLIVMCIVIELLIWLPR